MADKKKSKPAYDFGGPKAPWISDEDGEKLHRSDIERGSQFGIEFCSFMDVGYGLMNVQEKAIAEKDDFPRQDLQSKVLSIIDSPGVFGLKAKGVDPTFRSRVVRGVEQIVLGQFYHRLSELPQLERVSVSEPDPLSDKGRTLDVGYYWLSDTLQVREWEKGGIFAGVYHTLDVRDSRFRLTERVKSSNGKMCEWERFHYDRKGTVDIYVKTLFSENMPEAKVLKFENGLLSDAKEVTFYDERSGAVAKLTKRAHKHEGGLLTRFFATVMRGPEEGPGWAISLYSNSKGRALEYKSGLTSGIPMRGNTTWMRDVGLSDQNPSGETGYHQADEGSWIGIRYDRQWSWGQPDEEDEAGRTIWSQMKFGHESPIILSKLDANTVELERPDGAKSRFPLELDLKELQQSIAQEGLYK